MNFTFANSLASSNFQTVIFGFVHFHPEDAGMGYACTLRWDDERFCDFDNATMIEWFNTIKAGLPGRILMITIGGAAPYGNADIANITLYWDLFANALKAYLPMYPIDGIDINLEGADPFNDAFAPAMWNIAQFCLQKGLYLSISPPFDYYAPNWAQYMHNVSILNGTDTIISWSQPQLYSGDPDTIYGDYYSNFIHYFPNLPNIIYPGYGVCNDPVNCDIKGMVLYTELMYQQYKVTGAMLYTFSNIWDNYYLPPQPNGQPTPAMWGGNLTYALTHMPIITTTIVNTTTLTTTTSTATGGDDTSLSCSSSSTGSSSSVRTYTVVDTHVPFVEDLYSPASTAAGTCAPLPPPFRGLTTPKPLGCPICLSPTPAYPCPPGTGSCAVPSASASASATVSASATASPSATVTATPSPLHG